MDLLKNPCSIYPTWEATLQCSEAAVHFQEPASITGLSRPKTSGQGLSPKTELLHLFPFQRFFNDGL